MSDAEDDAAAAVLKDTATNTDPNPMVITVVPTSIPTTTSGPSEAPIKEKDDVVIVESPAPAVDSLSAKSSTVAAASVTSATSATTVVAAPASAEANALIPSGMSASGSDLVGVL
jgi:hypothetical protein